MVREVESLEPELDRVFLRESKVLVGREVPRDDAGRHNRVPAGVAESSEWLKHESVGVEPAIDIAYIARQDRRLSRRVYTIVADACVRLISAGNDGLRESTLERQNRTDLPSSKHRAGDATLVEEPPSLTEGQFVEQRRHRPVRHIETGQTALRAEIVAALGKQQVRVMNSDRASVVDRARPRITKEVGQTLRKPALQFHAQRIVVRLAAAIDLLEPAKLRIGSPRGYRPGCRWDRVVEGPEDLEFTAHRADVAHLQGRVPSKFALYVKHVLDGIGRPAIVDVGKAVRIDNQGRRLSQASVWTVPVQIQLSRRRFVATAARCVARHVEAWVAGILRVKQAGASADHPFGARVPGDAEARRKIIFVVGHKPVAEPAVACDLHRGLEPDQQTIVKVARSLTHQGWVAAHIRDIRSHVDKGNIEVDQVPGLVQKWRRVLVSQPEVDRYLRMNLPRIVDVIGLARRAELDLGGRHRPLVALAIAKQVLRKRVARARHRGALCVQLRRDIRFETELAAQEQVAGLGVLVPTQFAAPAQRMTSRRPPEVVDRLVDAVRVGVGTIDVAEGAGRAR